MDEEQRIEEQVQSDWGKALRMFKDSLFLYYCKGDKSLAEKLKLQLIEEDIDFVDLGELPKQYNTAQLEEDSSGPIERPAVIFAIFSQHCLYGPDSIAYTEMFWNITQKHNAIFYVLLVGEWDQKESLKQNLKLLRSKNQILINDYEEEKADELVHTRKKVLSETQIRSLKILFPNPFKGPIPYSESDRIYGRSSDIENLYERIRVNKLTLFYSKSGNGKTSLLRAGLIPDLEISQQFFPVYIRLTSADVNSWKSIVELIEKKLKVFGERFGIIYNEAIAENAGSLFEYIYAINIHFQKPSGDNQAVVPVLIFDQFEEIFTVASSLKESLIKELEYLLENKIPQELVIKGAEDDDEIGYRELVDKIASKDKPFRIMLSFREEYYLSIDSLKETIPTIQYTNGKYRLESFSEQEAADTITKISRNLISLKTAKSLSTLLARVQYEAEELPYNSIGKVISPFMLSLNCRDFYSALIGIGENVFSIRIQEMSNSKDIREFKDRVNKSIDKYFEKCFFSLNPATKEFIEEKLISREGKRTLFPYNDIKDHFKNKEADAHPSNDRATLDARLKEDIDLLINDPDHRYLNKNKYLNIPHVEVLHDQLTLPIVKSRDQREALEKFEKEARERQEAREKQEKELADLRIKTENELLQEKTKQEKAISKRKQRSLWFLLAVGLSIGLVLSSIFFTFYSDTIGVISDFANDDEKRTLEYLEREGTYLAFLQASKFYDNVDKKILSKYRFPYSKKLSNLKDSVSQIMITAFNKKPFFVIQDQNKLTPNPFPYSLYHDKYVSQAGNIIYQKRSDTLLSTDIISLKTKIFKLMPVSDSIKTQIIIPNGQSILNGTKNNAYGVSSGTIFRQNEEYMLLTNNQYLYIFKNDESLSCIDTIKLIQPPADVSFSLDNKFIILFYPVGLHYSNLPDGKQRVPDRKVGEPLRNNYILWRFGSRNPRGNSVDLSFAGNEKILNVCTKGDGSLTLYTETFERVSNANKNKLLWENFFSSTFGSQKVKIRRYSYITKLDNPESLDSALIERQVLSDSYSRSGDGRFLFLQNMTTHQWKTHVLDRPDYNAIDHSKLIEKPVFLYSQGRDTIIITKDGSTQVLRNNITSNPVPIKIKGDFNQTIAYDSTNLTITSITKSNDPRWLRVSVAIAGIPYFGILSREENIMYVFEQSLISSELFCYIHKGTRAVALIPGYRSPSVLYSEPVLYWFFNKRDSITNQSEIKKWKQLNFDQNLDSHLLTN